MKKFLMIFLTILLLVSFSLVGIGCKTTTAAQTTAEVAETTAAGAETTVAVETTAAAGEIVLKIADWQNGNQGILDSYNALAEIFTKENPGVKIDYQQYTVTTFNEFLKPAIASGTAPDIFGVYPGPDLKEVAESGALVDLTPKIDDEWKGWLGAAYDFKGIRYNDKIWIVPQDVWTECMWYHKDMLEEIGFEPKPSTEAYTIEELASMVEPAKAKGYDVILAGFVETWCYYDVFFNFVHQQQKAGDPDLIEEAMSGKVSWQQDVFKNAFNAFVKLNDAGVWRKDVFNMDYQVQAFGKWLERESIFMWAQGDWFASAMKPEENSADNPNIGIIQYPMVNDTSEVVYNKNFGTDLGVYAKGKNIDLAIKWIRLTNSPEAANIFMTNGVNPASGADLNNLPEITNPVLKDCITLYNTPGTQSEVYYLYPDAVKALGDGIGALLLETDNLDNILKNLDAVCGFKG